MKRENSHVCGKQCWVEKITTYDTYLMLFTARRDSARFTTCFLAWKNTSIFYRALAQQQQQQPVKLWLTAHWQIAGVGVTTLAVLIMDTLLVSYHATGTSPFSGHCDGCVKIWYANRIRVTFADNKLHRWKRSLSRLQIPGVYVSLYGISRPTWHKKRNNRADHWFKTCGTFSCFDTIPACGDRRTDGDLRLLRLFSGWPQNNGF